MKKTHISALLILLLSGCISSATMDQQFYDGIKQSSAGFGETIGDVALFIGMYEGSTSMLQSKEWQDSIMVSSEKLVGNARALYSIVDTYCPRDEKILCDDIEVLYNKVRTLHGTLEAAIKDDSRNQMNAALQRFDEILAHMEAMDER